MLRPTSGNMYDFITHTWNPIKGECPHGCTYCYMRRWGAQKPLRLDEREMRTDFVNKVRELIAALENEGVKVVQKRNLKRILGR